MKFCTGFGLVLIAASTVATAQPRRDENSARLSYNEKQEAPAAAPRREGGTVQIVTPTSVKHGKEFIVVGEEAGQFTQLRLDAARGKVTVHRVRIDFTDGTTRSVLLDKVIAKGKSTTVDLKKPKAIEQIVITTDTEPSGEYAVYGISGSETGGVASR